MMNDKQKAAKELLQSELLKQRGITKPLSDDGESKEGYSFTEVEGVTVCFGPDGGLILPAVRTYIDALQAAVFADEKFMKNRARGLTRVDTTVALLGHSGLATALIATAGTKFTSSGSSGVYSRVGVVKGTAPVRRRTGLGGPQRLKRQTNSLPHERRRSRRQPSLREVWR